MRLIRKIVAKASLLFVVIILVSCSHRSDTSRDNMPLPVLPFARRLEDALNHALRSSQGDHDLGISAAVIVSGYELWSGVSGYSHRGVSITPDMLFDAGSIAKNFEAALVMKMTEERLINLDDPLSKSLPVYRNVDRDITIRQLLKHTFISMGEPPTAHFSVAHPWVDVDQDGNLKDLFGAPFTWKVTLTHPVLFTTSEDLARWMHALYHERSVLDSDLLEEMLTYPETTHRDPEGGIYGLGVVDYSELLGMQVVGHGGSSLGYSAAALYLPDYGTSLAWSINTGESPSKLAEAIMGNTWSFLSEVLCTHMRPAP